MSGFNERCYRLITNLNAKFHRSVKPALWKSLTIALVVGLGFLASPLHAQTLTSLLASRIDFTAGTGPVGAVAGDIDGDGKADIVLSNLTSNTLSVHRNTSTSGGINAASFATKVEVNTGNTPRWVVAGDFDGDGLLDLATAASGDDNLEVYLNTSSVGSVSFAAAVTSATNNDPNVVATSDIDGDGKLDIGVTTWNGGAGTTVSLYRNLSSTGAISVAAKSDVTTGTGPERVAFGDVDGDGKPDMAVANSGGANASVYRNTASAGTIDASSFAAAVNFTVGTTPQEARFADVDGDGNLDLLASNTASNTVSVLRNTATSGVINGSSFAAKQDFATGTLPRALGIGDLDGDGKPDLSLSNGTANTISLLKNTSSSGSVSFAAKVDLTAGTGPYGNVIVDIDGDGRPELTHTNFSDNDVSVLHNIADPPSIISISPTSGKVGDSVTITGTNFDATAVNNTVFFGATKATVTAASTTSLTATVPPRAMFAPLSVTVDNRTAESRDFFLPTFAGEFPTIDPSTFGAKVDFTTAAGPLLSVPADIDGDGKTDLVVLNQSASSFSVFRNTSTVGTIDGSTYAAKVDFTTGTTPAGMAIADYDGNGVVDVSTTNSATDDVSVFRNTSTVGSVSFAAKVEYTAGDQPTVMIARDMDLDGKTDMVTANNLTADVSVIRNTSTPGTIAASSFAAKVDFTVGTQPREVAVGDIDGDDLPDIVTGNFSTNNFSVLRSTSTPGTITASSFAGKVDFAALINPEGLEIVDLDGDGKEDVAVANFSSSMISVFRNTSVSGTPSFATRVDYISGVQPQDISIGDIDGDGKPDIAAGNANFGAGVTVSVLRNTSTSGTIDASSFAPKVDFTTPLNPIQATIVDVDGDGAPELISANGGAASISVFRNITPTTPAATITSFTPISAKPEDSVAITGTNFDTTPANNTVLFGATKGTVTSSSTTSLTVTVPSGASFAPIAVTKNNRTATSEDLFLPTYAGIAQTISTGTYADRITFTTNATAWRTAIADLDGDGKPDMVVTNNGPDDISVYHNQSTSGGINGSSFAGQLNYATGTDPVGVAIGDLDGDGKPEIAVANIAAVSVSVFHNTSSPGSISFAAKQDFAANGNPVGVAIGDLDGDGKNDLAVTSQASSLISVHRNTSVTGTIDANSFATKVTFTTGTTTFDVAIADIDGDGKKDLVSGNSGGDSVSILRNTATAGEITTSSFAAKQDFSVGDQPSKVAIGDIDGDGKLDIATGNQTDNTLSVLRNTSTIGTVSFAGQVTFATGTQPISTAIGDLDGDGDADIATSNDPGSMSLFKNNSVSGSISLSPEVNYSFVVAARDIAVADLDGDDRPEIVIPNLNSGIVSVLHNIADPPIVSAISPTSARVGKTVTITGSGFDATAAKNSVYFGAIKANVATATTTSLTAEVPTGATFNPLIVRSETRSASSQTFFAPNFDAGPNTIDASTFDTKVDFGAGVIPRGTKLVDIDGDDKADVVLVDQGSNVVSVYRNTAATGVVNASSLASKLDFTTGTQPIGVAPGDLDGDGMPDLAVANAISNTLSILRNTSTSGSVSFAAKVDFTTGNGPNYVAVSDVDGDGKPDIAVANRNANTVSVARNTSVSGTIEAASFAAKEDFTTGTNPLGVALGDIDGDGKTDMAVANWGAASMSAFHNTSTAGTFDVSTFAAKEDFTVGANPREVGFGDLDGDGKLDLAVTNEGPSNVSVLRNTSTSGSLTSASLAAKVDFTTGTGTRRIALGDLEGDGDLDLAVTNQTASTVSLLRNTSTSGSVSFAAKVDLATGTGALGLALGDVDGDGRPDLVVGNNTADSLSIFRNQSLLKTVGLSGTTTVSPGSEVQLFRIGLVSYGSYTLNGISVTVSDLSSATGITSSDLELRMYRSTDETFDTGDTQIGTQSSVNLGSATTISPSSAENPVDHTFYIVTAFINSSANDGNAFKLGFAQNGVTTSAGGEGAAIAASDGNNITSVVTATKWVFTTEPTGAIHLQELTPQPGLAARDDNGNLDVNVNGTVTLSVSPSGSLSQSTFTAANGLVPTGNVTISGAGSRTLIATGLGLTPDTTAAFEVAKAAATVTLNNLLAVSDGNPKIGGATTDPPGLEVIFTHNEFGVPLDSPPIEPGAYGVTGTVNDSNYQGSATGTLHILLDDPPKAGFAASATQGNPPFTVTFTDRSSGQVDTWFLEPGADNGRVYESRNDSVTVIYSTPGTYTVFLTVRGGGFTDQTSLDIIVNGPPNLENIGDASANEDDTLVLDLSGIDAETGTWTLSGTDQTLISASSIEGDQITFTPVPHANGSDVLTITRTNVHSLSTSQDVTLTWVPVDDAPTIVDLASTYSAAEDNAIHVGAVANVTDLDSDVGTLVWSASGFDGVLVGSTTASNNGVDLTPAVNAFGETKGLCRNNRSIFSIPGWMDGVVPVSVKGVTFQVDLGHLFIAEGDALGIRPLVDFGSDTQSGFRGR